MQTAVIIDIIVGAVLLAFVLFGAARGLFRALAGLLIVVIALVGAGWVANTFSASAAELLSPVIERQLTDRIETRIKGSADAAAAGNPAEMPDTESPPTTGGDGGGSALDLLAVIGLDNSVVDAVTERVREGLADTVSSIAAAAASELTKSIVYGLLYILAFLLLTLVLHLLAKAVDLALKLPVLHGANALGGALIGALEGVLFLFLAIWAARKLGVTFFDSALAEKTYLLRFFAANTPLSALALLR